MSESKKFRVEPKKFGGWGMRPIEDKVDPKNPFRRDGAIFVDKPTLTRMQNTIRYMQTHPVYLPPNPWPKGVLLFGLDHRGIMSCAFFMRLDQFEQIPEAELF